jgi:thioester reductase-like protein
MSTVFFTGFPGFLGSELLPRVLARSPAGEAVCLVQAKFADLARRRLAELAAAHPQIAGRVRLVEGDITRPDLGLGGDGGGADGGAALRDAITEIYHLAAVYDLAVPRAVGMTVNVLGTRHLLDFAADCPRLARFHYVSTCYVSGRYPGVFSEDDLINGQRFQNFYEETKYLAEVEVQQRMAEGLPATVYRPAIVVGDSRTGATQKYDGPYYVARWILRQRGVAVVPVVGDTATNRTNLVPRDFVVDAIAHLSGLARSAGRVYQLADPAPLTIDELLAEIARAAGRRVVYLPLPLGVAKGALDYVPFVYRILQIPSSAVDYFVHPTAYTTTNVQADLAGSGIAVPPFRSYVDRMVGFMKAHPEIGSAAMV